VRDKQHAILNRRIGIFTWKYPIDFHNSVLEHQESLRSLYANYQDSIAIQQT
jgi:hypothetical protein